VITLVLNTVDPLAEVAVFSKQGTVLAEKTQAEIKLRPSQVIFALMQEALAAAAVSLEDLGAVVTNIGPGSFTGIRLSLAAAAGLTLSADIPMIGVTYFEAVAEDSNAEAGKLVILRSGKRDFFVGQVGAPLEGVVQVSADNIVGHIPSGQAVLAPDHHVAADLANRGVQVVGLQDAVQVNLYRASLRKTASAEIPDPVYIRGADVSFSRNAKTPA